jgi:hypothetical protein
MALDSEVIMAVSTSSCSCSVGTNMLSSSSLKVQGVSKKSFTKVQRIVCTPLSVNVFVTLATLYLAVIWKMLLRKTVLVTDVKEVHFIAHCCKCSDFVCSSDLYDNLAVGLLLSPGWLYEISGEQSGTETGFSQGSLVFPSSLHYSHIIMYPGVWASSGQAPHYHIYHLQVEDIIGGLISGWLQSKEPLFMHVSKQWQKPHLCMKQLLLDWFLQLFIMVCLAKNKLIQVLVKIWQNQHAL